MGKKLGSRGGKGTHRRRISQTDQENWTGIQARNIPHCWVGTSSRHTTTSTPQCVSKVRVFSVIPGGWLRSRPQRREMGSTGRDPVPGAGKAIGRALGHGVCQVICLFLQLPSALCAHPTSSSWGHEATTTTTQLWQDFSSCLPKESVRRSQTADIALLISFISDFNSSHSASPFLMSKKEKWGEAQTFKLGFLT